MISEQIQEWLDVDDGGQCIRSVEGIFTLATDVGTKRKENQDRVAILRVSSAARNSGFWCACLCDGMGGMKEGGHAATLATSYFLQSLIYDRKLEPEERIHRATMEANNYVRNKIPGGGSTLSAILWERDCIYTVNVGDSRIYLLDERSPERLSRLTTDDTMKEAYGSEGRGLLQHIGMSGKILPHVRRIEKDSGGEFILTSDGAHRIGDEYLHKLWDNSSNSAEYCERVVSVARWIGGVDNASLISAKLHSYVTEAARSESPDVSIWTTAGRMKISWSATSRNPRQHNNRNPEFPADRARGQNESRTPEASRLENENRAAKNEKKPARKNSEAGAKKGNRAKNADDQIELGFTDDDSEA